MKFDGFHHIGLITDDAERSLKFYTEGLGGKTAHSFIMGDTGRLIYLVDLGGNAVVEIIPRGNAGGEENARWAHVAVHTDDARAAYAKALEAGAKPRTEPGEVSLGAMPAVIAFVTGPDGEVIEFFQTEL